MNMPKEKFIVESKITSSNFYFNQDTTEALFNFVKVDIPEILDYESSSKQLYLEDTLDYLQVYFKNGNDWADNITGIGNMLLKEKWKAIYISNDGYQIFLYNIGSKTPFMTFDLSDEMKFTKIPDFNSSVDLLESCAKILKVKDKREIY